jgi:UDP-N-acetylenolpyruvoylglucosamine reductase
MEERTAAIALLRQQERALSLLKQEQEQQVKRLLRGQQQDDQVMKDGRTMGNGSDLLFMDHYMRPARTVGTLAGLLYNYCKRKQVCASNPSPDLVCLWQYSLYPTTCSARGDPRGSSLLSNSGCLGRAMQN